MAYTEHGPYSWLVPPWDVELPEPHELLLSMLPQAPTLARPKWSPFPRSSDMAPLVLVVQNASEGNRNIALYWAACCALDDGHQVAEVIDAFTAASTLPADEVEATVLSAGRR